jgi:hypothetical protein
MNLFILSLNLQECVEFMFDKHIAKIILEAIQMLCTTVRILDPDSEVHTKVKLYREAHKNHPVTVWMRTSLENYLWTLDLVDAMHQEWKYRYDHPQEKVHASYLLMTYLRTYAPSADKFPVTGLTPFAQAMPDEYKHEDPIEAYRQYYQSPEKRRLASWKKRERPAWFKGTEDKAIADQKGTENKAADKAV